MSEELDKDSYTTTDNRQVIISHMDAINTLLQLKNQVLGLMRDDASRTAIRALVNYDGILDTISDHVCTLMDRYSGPALNQVKLVVRKQYMVLRDRKDGVPPVEAILGCEIKYIHYCLSISALNTDKLLEPYKDRIVEVEVSTDNSRSIADTVIWLSPIDTSDLVDQMQDNKDTSDDYTSRMASHLVDRMLGDDDDDD